MKGKEREASRVFELPVMLRELPLQCGAPDGFACRFVVYMAVRRGEVTSVHYG